MAKIILVEDEINIASFIERGLREFGHEVSVVYDGNAGWEQLLMAVFKQLMSMHASNVLMVNRI